MPTLIKIVKLLYEALVRIYSTVKKRFVTNRRSEDYLDGNTVLKITTEITQLSEFLRQTKCNKTGEDLQKQNRNIANKQGRGG